MQTPTSNTYTYWYKTFSTITGLDRFIGQTIAVVADGGYLDSYAITGSSLTLPKQVASVCVGYPYRGMIKGFPLGFQLQGQNTQKTMKNITAAHVRCVSTAGGKVGGSMYKLEVIQELTPDDINYLPPLPVDGTKKVSYSDTSDVDKCLYIVQDLPLPMNNNSLILDAEYATT